MLYEVITRMRCAIRAAQPQLTLPAVGFGECFAHLFAEARIMSVGRKRFERLSDQRLAVTAGQRLAGSYNFV